MSRSKCCGFDSNDTIPGLAELLGGEMSALGYEKSWLHRRAEDLLEAPLMRGLPEPLQLLAIPISLSSETDGYDVKGEK